MLESLYGRALDLYRRHFPAYLFFCCLYLFAGILFSFLFPSTLDLSANTLFLFLSRHSELAPILSQTSWTDWASLTAGYVVSNLLLYAPAAIITANGIRGQKTNTLQVLIQIGKPKNLVLFLFHIIPYIFIFLFAGALKIWDIESYSASYFENPIFLCVYLGMLSYAFIWIACEVMGPLCLLRSYAKKEPIFTAVRRSFPMVFRRFRLILTSVAGYRVVLNIFVFAFELILSVFWPAQAVNWFTLLIQCFAMPFYICLCAAVLLETGETKKKPLAERARRRFSNAVDIFRKK